SPVGSILGAAELGIIELQSAAPDPKNVLAYMEMVQKNALRLHSYVQDLLNIAKIQDSNISLKKSGLDLVFLIQSTVESYRPLAHLNGNDLVFTSPPTCIIQADSEKL